MLARNARKLDAKALDALLDDNSQGDVRLDRDTLVVSGAPANGALVWRACAFIHEFECPGRLTANALVNYAVGQASGRTAVIRDAIFLVDPSNEKMVKYVEQLGAVEHHGRVFILDVG